MCGFSRWSTVKKITNVDESASACSEPPLAGGVGAARLVVEELENALDEVQCRLVVRGVHVLRANVLFLVLGRRELFGHMFGEKMTEFREIIDYK